MALMAVVILAVAGAGGWGAWRLTNHGLMSFELERLVEHIETGTEDEAKAAADEIVERKNRAWKVISFLTDIVADPDSPNRLIAAETLHRLEASSEEVIAVLTVAAGDADRQLRHVALHALSDLGPAAESATDTVMGQLSAPDAETRRLAARALGNIDFINIRAEDALVTALEDTEPAVRSAALAALVKVGAELPGNALEMLTSFMKSGDTGVRTDAIKALGMLGSEAEQALPVIEAAMTDGAREVRYNAAWALGRMGDAHPERIVPLLATALEADEDEDVRIQSAWALGQMGEHARAASAVLYAALEDPELGVRRESYETLKIVAKSAGDHENLEAALASLVPANRSCDAPE